MRWAGCQVVDVGATPPSAALFALDHLKADGAIALGEERGFRGKVRWDSWGPKGEPLAASTWREIQRIDAADSDRPAR